MIMRFLLFLCGSIVLAATIYGGLYDPKFTKDGIGVVVFGCSIGLGMYGLALMRYRYRRDDGSVTFLTPTEVVLKLVFSPLIGIYLILRNIVTKILSLFGFRRQSVVQRHDAAHEANPHKRDEVVNCTEDDDGDADVDTARELEELRAKVRKLEQAQASSLQTQTPPEAVSDRSKPRSILSVEADIRNAPGYYQCAICGHVTISEREPNGAGCPKSHGRPHKYAWLGKALTTQHLICGIGVKNYQCVHCRTLLQTNGDPQKGGCPAKGRHAWQDLGTVGDITFQCSRCSTSVKSASSPANNNCPSGGSHHWRKI